MKLKGKLLTLIATVFLLSGTLTPSIQAVAETLRTTESPSQALGANPGEIQNITEPAPSPAPATNSGGSTSQHQPKAPSAAPPGTTPTITAPETQTSPP